MIETLSGTVRTSIPSFVVGIGGFGLAWLWLEAGVLAAAAIAIVLLAIGLLAYLVGASKLSRDKPLAVSARRWLEWTIAAPIALAAFVAAGVIVLAIATAPADDWSEEKKQLIAALAATITTYLTTVFVKGADEADEGWVGGIVEDRFQELLKGRFPPGKARDAVFDRIRKWGRDDRKLRATEIDEYIDGGGEVLARS